MSESPEDKFRTLDDPDTRPTVPVELVVGEPGWQLIIPARAESLAAFLDVGIVGVEMEKTVITARELCALSGITPRRLRWWIERGVIKARIVEHRCLLNQRQALAALIVCELRISGFRLDQIRRLKLLPARADYLGFARWPRALVRPFYAHPAAGTRAVGLSRGRRPGIAGIIAAAEKRL